MKKPPGVVGRLLLLPGVFIFCHYPDRSNHKGSLLRKKEDNNQDNDNVKGLHKVHFGLPFNFAPPLPSPNLGEGWEGVTKKPPVVGRLVLLFAGVLILLSPQPSQPSIGP
jgi:hypothetical protein